MRINAVWCVRTKVAREPLAFATCVCVPNTTLHHHLSFPADDSIGCAGGANEGGGVNGRGGKGGRRQTIQ
jgi:hypothetical protein